MGDQRKAGHPQNPWIGRDGPASETLHMTGRQRQQQGMSVQGSESGQFKAKRTGGKVARERTPKRRQSCVIKVDPNGSSIVRTAILREFLPAARTRRRYTAADERSRPSVIALPNQGHEVRCGGMTGSPRQQQRMSV